ncbi:MAG: ArsR family transcriptional regulator, cadmium/lead-responsive transcriptional repressor [Chloroflexota bacterium]|jgi:DNA-binding transcriptional ArsR family regulator|nr:ArsR family transcriptional regulator, cadmium/lead-responsive transcriptional repressor [Chloroflexota bacterium]
MALAEMDIQAREDATPQARGGNRLITSAPAELFWALFAIAGDKGLAQHHVDIPPARALRLQKRVRQFWNDGCACYTELMVLAGRGGHLEDEANDAFLQGITRLAASPLERGILRCETAADLVKIRARLAALRSDPTARRAYVRLLSEVWDLVRPAWERDGIGQVRRVADGWQQQLERGGKLIPTTMPGAGPSIAGILESAETNAAEGRLLVAPTFFGGGYMIVDVPGGTILSSSGDRAHPARSVRTEAEKAAPRFKALADPTRIAILSMLQAGPHGISEVARRLQLSQPTVSAHFNALRGAGLVLAETEGRVVRYRLDGERLDGILDEIRTLVREGCA